MADPTPAPQLPGDALTAKYGPRMAAAEHTMDTAVKQYTDAGQAAYNALPTPPTQQFKFQPPPQSGLVAGLMMLFGALAGRKTMTPMTSAIEAMTGTLQGLHQGNLEAYQMQKDAFDRNYKQAVNAFNEGLQKYNAAMELHKGNLAAAEQPLKDIALEMGLDTKAADLNTRFMEAQKAMEQLHAQMAHWNAQIGLEHGKALASLMGTGMSASDAENVLHGGAPSMSGDSSAISPADRMMAENFLMTGHNPPARGGAYERTMRAIPIIAKELKVSPEQLLAVSAQHKATLSGFLQTEKRMQNVDRAANTLNNEMSAAQHSLSKLNLPHVPLEARAELAARRMAGDPTVTAFDTGLNMVLNEFQSIATANPGALNVIDVQNAMSEAKNITTPQQFAAWQTTVKNIIERAKAANNETRNEITRSIQSLAGTPAPPEPSNLPPGFKPL